MRVFVPFLLLLISYVAKASLIYPGQTIDINYVPTTGEYGPLWTTDNPTLNLSSVGFLCHVTAQSYFGGTATVTCTYKDRIGTTISTRTRRWTFTCADTNISISPTSKNVKVGESFQISWGFSNATYINPIIQFTGYDTSVISVSNSGLVTAKSEGETQIYVMSNLGTNSVKCTVRVNAESSESTSGTASAYDNWDTTGTKLITLEQPGTLSEYISTSEKYGISNLTIVGPLNGYDLRLLRDMCGLDENNSSTNGNLVVLDLKDAVFVSGGPWYVKAYDSYAYISDDSIMPRFSFAWMKKLRKIRFPKYCTELTNSSLLQCQSLELMLIPPGVTTIDYYSLDGGYEDMPMSVLTLPSSTKRIDADVYNCNNLTDIYSYAIEPPIITYPKSFRGQTNITKGTLYVPMGCAQSYWEAEGWRDFKEIKETLGVFRTLSVIVGEHGKVKFNDIEIKQKYGVSYTGYQAFEVSSEEDVSVEIIPEEGYLISNIYLDDQPQGIPTDKILKIGKLQSHSKLRVYFDKNTSINDIFNKSENVKVDIFNLQGVMVRRKIKTEEISNIPSGVYIVKGDRSVQKILIP